MSQQRLPKLPDSLFWGGLLAAALLMPGCSLGEIRPPTPKEQRLGASEWALPGLSPSRSLPASGFLLPGTTLREIEPDLFEVTAWLNGRYSEGDGLKIHWKLAEESNESGVLPPSASAPVRLSPIPRAPKTEGNNHFIRARVSGPGSWSGTVELSSQGRRIGQLQFERPTSQPSPRWVPPTLLRAVPLEVGACRSTRFPWQVGDFHIGCSPGKVEPPSLDRKVSVVTGRSFPFVIHFRERGLSQSRPLLPNEANVGPRGDGGLIWSFQSRVGVWPNKAGKEARIHPAPLRGRPALSDDLFALARADRIEVGVVATGTRSLIASHPADSSANLAVESPWLAYLNQTPHHEELVLRHLDSSRETTIPTEGRPFRPMLIGSWLLWEDRLGLHGLPLEGGRSWLTPVRTDLSLMPTVVDDWLLLREQAGPQSGLIAIHIASGTIRRPNFEGERRQVEARGAGGGHLTLWERGTAGPGQKQMQLYTLQNREFDPRGPHAQGTPLLYRPPAAAGPSLNDRATVPPPALTSWLPRGGERQLHLDPGPEANLVEIWVQPDDSPIPIDLSQGAVLVARTDNLSVPSPEEGGHWVPLGHLPAKPGASPEERSVTLRWFASREPGTVGKLRLRRLENRP